jgi:hypothetical protein
MPSLIGDNIAANYRQQQVPFSRFGTRKVAFYKIGHTDFVDGGGNLNMTNFNKVIDAIQTQMEIVLVGAPYIATDTGWNKFVIAVFEDTANNGANTDLSDQGEVGYNSNSNTLEQTLTDLDLGGQGPTVQRIYLYGAPNNDETDPQGFSTQASRQEYDTKAQFVEDSYVVNPAP